MFFVNHLENHIFFDICIDYEYDNKITFELLIIIFGLCIKIYVYGEFFTKILHRTERISPKVYNKLGHAELMA